MADDAAKAKADRIRSLLSNYYGAGESAAPTASTGSDRPLAKTSVSGVPTLNPEEQHIADILRTYPLERLLTEHRSMAREIKNLDSDMQQLICERIHIFFSLTAMYRYTFHLLIFFSDENYSRFINATDTIRQMKASVGKSMSKGYFNYCTGTVCLSLLTDGMGGDMDKLKEVMGKI